MNERAYRFGKVRSLPEEVAESRQVPFILSTETRDRYGTVIHQDKWQLDNYRLNPIVGFMHNLYGDFCNPPDPDRVIGKDVGLRIEETEYGSSLVGLTEFEPAEINPLAEKVFRKIMFGSLNTCSVGFLEIGKGEEVQEEDGDGKIMTYHFSAQELLEYSIVNIPGNPKAIKQKDLRMRALRDHAKAALLYTYKELGGRLRFSQIEDLRVRDILDLLEGKDLDIHTSDPDKARQMIKSAAEARVKLLKMNSQ